MSKESPQPPTQPLLEQTQEQAPKQHSEQQPEQHSEQQPEQHSEQQPEQHSEQQPEQSLEQQHTSFNDDPVHYSVQINRTPGTPCAVCEKNLSAEGPVGHLNDAPVCDVCLLVNAQELGMMVALAVLVRAFANDADQSPSGPVKESLSLLVVFARIYNRQACWPRRDEFSQDLPISDLDFLGLERQESKKDKEKKEVDPEDDLGLH